jgi:uncharacterized membrane protein
METILVTLLVHFHIIALSLWFGGLFCYLLMVWPAIVTRETKLFPRQIIAAIGTRTFPWIYFAMIVALLSFLAVWGMGALPFDHFTMGVYGFFLVGLFLNNLYGTVVAWPQLMLESETAAYVKWKWYKIRMSLSFIVGITLHSLVVFAT